MAKIKESNQPIRNVSWQEIDSLIQKMANEIPLRSDKKSGLYGLPRGGLVVALLLSYSRLNLKFGQHDLGMIGGIFCEDIVDSGKTMEFFYNSGFYSLAKDRGNKIITASLFYRRGASIKPDYYCEKLDDNVWIKFPWETEA